MKQKLKVSNEISLLLIKKKKDQLQMCLTGENHFASFRHNAKTNKDSCILRTVQFSLGIFYKAFPSSSFLVDCS